MNVELAVAKTNKYASRESGDTVEVIERPHGGFSVVLADGQGSGRSAKTTSHMVTTKAISLLKDGARDGVAARMVHDYLYTYKGGQVSATLVIISVDLVTRTLVLTRNSHCPILVSAPDQPELMVLQDFSNAIGIYPATRPVITELPLQENTYLVTYTDGLMEAGMRDNRPIDLTSLFNGALAAGKTNASSLAEYLLAQALEADGQRPADDMSVVVIAMPLALQQEPGLIIPQVRRLAMDFPV
ncbi:MAG: PP2C family protein-serine/threonine phosphatase [Chloroflexota bacterium]